MKGLLSRLNRKSDFVLGFIRNAAGKRLGLRVYSVATGKVAEVPMPQDAAYLNLSINSGSLDSKYCRISEFPEFTGEALGACLPGVKGAYVWVLSRYADGRLKLVSVTGQSKVVTTATALGFHKQYGISVGK